MISTCQCESCKASYNESRSRVQQMADWIEQHGRARFKLLCPRCAWYERLPDPIKFVIEGVAMTAGFAGIVAAVVVAHVLINT